MRRVLIAAVASIVATATVARADDKLPVWLGVGYTGGGAGVIVTEVYEDSAAAQAGVQVGDEIVELGGQPTPPQAVLRAIIAPLKVGDHVKIKAFRAGRLKTFDAIMLPRADREMIQRRLVDKPAPEVEITRISDGAVVDLAALKGKVAILAFFQPGCDDCAGVVSALGPWLRKHDRDPVVAMGATPIGEPAGLKAYLARNPITIPVGAMPLPTDASRPQTFFADPSVQAVTFVVIDGKGIVRLASIVAPGHDDEVDDVCVAAERALKSLKRR